MHMQCRRAPPLAAARSLLPFGRHPLGLTPRGASCDARPAATAAAAAAPPPTPAPHQQQQLPWWDAGCDDAGLQQLSAAVDAVLSLEARARLHPGPALLEQLAAVEVRRANLLRPASYVADFSPQHAAAAASLQAAAADASAPLHACLPLLACLLATVRDAVQQLAAAAAAAAAAGADTGSGDCWVALPADGSVVVHPAAAAAAAAMAAQAAQCGQDAATQAAAAAAAADGSGSNAAALAAAACAAAVQAVQQGLQAVDAALNSTLPAGGSGGGCVPQLMVCRHLLAAWPPPVAAQSAYAAAATAAGDGAAAGRGGPSSADGSRLTTRQRLKQALAALSAVSSSSSSTTSSSTAAVAPLLLMTAQQADVLEAVLACAGVHTERSPAFVALQHAAANMTAAASCDHLVLPRHASLEVHRGVSVHLTGLMAVTDEVQQRLYSQHQAAAAAGHQGQGKPAGSSADASISVPLALEPQLRLLRVSTDVLQLLLSQHPHPGVRQQLYFHSLLPLLHTQQQVLAAIVALRQQLAAEQAAGDYAQLVLAGSCLGGAAAASGLIQQLLPYAEQHAADEWREWQQLAARRVLKGYGQPHVEPWDVAFAASGMARLLCDLNWCRDLAPYFTLPGLMTRLDRLLHAAFALQLLPADDPGAVAAQAAPAGASQGLRPWGPHVMHCVLLTAAPPQPELLGHVMLELVSGGFPSCSLLQLPTPLCDSSSSNGGQQHSSGVTHRPGAVALRVPVPAAARIKGFGQHEQQEEAVSLALPSPAAFSALLHELGHALSFLCPAAHLQQQQQVDAEPPLPAAAAAAAGHPQQWLFQPLSPRTAPWSVSLLAGPPVGLDVREASSHFLEHWARHPASIVSLSCHERLGVPLPQATALQMARLMAAAPGGLSSTRLLHTLQDAQHDLAMHSSGAVSGDAHDSDSVPAGASGHPPGCALLDHVDELAAAGPVGGAKAGYVMARVLAAAAWKAWGSDAAGRRQPQRDQLAAALLYSGGFSPSHHIVTRLLQPVGAGVTSDAVLEPVWAPVPASDSRFISGWRPCLWHDAYQDIDLA